MAENKMSPRQDGYAAGYRRQIEYGMEGIATKVQSYPVPPHPLGSLER